jgi:hypothetical protein
MEVKDLIEYNLYWLNSYVGITPGQLEVVWSELSRESACALYASAERHLSNLKYPPSFGRHLSNIRCPRSVGYIRPRSLTLDIMNRMVCLKLEIPHDWPELYNIGWPWYLLRLIEKLQEQDEENEAGAPV